MVRRNHFIEVGGFNSPYWPGEDTKLCLDLIEKTNKKILYVPNLLVWHHRRAGLLAHLRQVGAYGLHRGYFARKYPKNSRKLKYFLPSLFVLYLLVIILSFIINFQLKFNLLAGASIYLIVLIFAAIDILKYESLWVALWAIIYTLLSHIYYGISFARGFFTINLVSRLR